MSDIAQHAAVKMFDALHSLQIKHSDFNQIFINLLSGEWIDKLSVCFLNVNYTPLGIFDQYGHSKFVLLVECFI